MCVCVEVVEMAVAESVIGRLVVQDPDNEGVDGVVQRFSFKLLSDHDGRFRIDGDKLKVTSRAGIGAGCTFSQRG